MTPTRRTAPSGRAAGSARTAGSRTRGTIAAAATVLALTLVVGGCGTGADSGPSTPKSSAPAATGTGPYPAPPDPPGSPGPPGAADASGTPDPSGPVHTPETSGKAPRGGAPRPADVDRNDADAVSRGALSALWTHDTAVDSRPQDAGVRAADAGWLTSRYAARLRAERPESAPGAQWREWTGHHAYTTVRLAEADEAGKPADSGTEAWRQWEVTASPRGRGGWKGEPATVVAFVHLTRTSADEVWRVADVTVP